MVARYEGAHTWSRLSEFDCALKFKLKHIEKRKEPANAAFVKGGRVHDGLDGFLKRRSKLIPDEAWTLRAELTALRKDKTLRGEEAWGYDRAWQPLPVTGYFSDADYIRAKVDAMTTKGDKCKVIDFKTGQVRSASPLQVRFYGMLALIREPKLNVAQLELWFVEQGQIMPFEPVKRSEVLAIKTDFQRRFKAIEDERAWKPTPGDACRFCPFTKHKGGPCRY
jgi:CRISPR/Cas system-associated exonuclease Cas4 (RecB family)